MATTKVPLSVLEGNRNRKAGMIAAWIGAGAVVLAGGFPLVQWLAERKPAPDAVAGAVVRITGRVANARTDEPVRKAEVSLEARGVPASTESDSKGIFSARLPAEYSTVRVRVAARGFKPYDQLLPRDAADEMVPVNLEPEAGSGKSLPNRVRDDDGGASVRPHASEPPPKAAKASMLNATLPFVSGDSRTWAVIIFGDHERRDDVTSAIRSTLAESGFDTVSLFRKTSDEQRVAPDVYRGNSDVLQEQQVGRYCSRILAAKLSIARLGVTEGITIARATLSVHVVSPAGELLNTFELVAKGGGEDDSSARRHAIDELLEAMPQEMPEKLK
jgi:hypothetical protein